MTGNVQLILKNTKKYKFTKQKTKKSLRLIIY